jgi:hypothetical protein
VRASRAAEAVRSAAEHRGGAPRRSTAPFESSVVRPMVATIPPNATSETVRSI